MPQRSGADRLPAAVLWDMDGTLIDSEKLWDIPLYEWAERAGGHLSTELRESMVGSNMARTAHILLDVVGRPVDAVAVAEVSAWIRTRMADVFAGDLLWRPGALDALRTVRSSGTPAALVTSTERQLTEAALNTIGAEFFDVTVCGDEVDGLNKPHPEPYLRAARLLGVDPARCVAVEDSPTGTASAAAAGCTVLVVPCDVSVAAGERRILRDSLVGLSIDQLSQLVVDPVAAGN